MLYVPYTVVFVFTINKSFRTIKSEWPLKTKKVLVNSWDHSTINMYNSTSTTAIEWYIEVLTLVLVEYCAQYCMQVYESITKTTIDTTSYLCNITGPSATTVQCILYSTVQLWVQYNTHTGTTWITIILYCKSSKSTAIVVL